MTTVQYYAALSEIIGDMELEGVKREDRLMGFIRAASKAIEKRGRFLPVTETRTYEGSGAPTLWIDPVLSISALTYDGAALSASDYVLFPHDRHWEDGPYTSIELETQGIWSNAVHDIMSIAGTWGLYNKTQATTARATQSTTGATALTVDNAAGVSPGMIVLIDSEQEAIEATGTPIDSGVILDDALGDAASIFDVDDATLLHIGETIRVDFEQMQVLDVLDNTILVMRGYNGTERATHGDKETVYVYRSFTVQRGVNGTTAAQHVNDPVYRVLPPEDVNYLCRQIATLMYRKAAGGYAGKTGNAELGEVFYHNEFPDDPIKQVMTNYRIVTI